MLGRTSPYPPTSIAPARPTGPKDGHRAIVKAELATKAMSRNPKSSTLLAGKQAIADLKGGGDRKEHGAHRVEGSRASRHRCSGWPPRRQPCDLELSRGERVA